MKTRKLLRNGVVLVATCLINFSLFAADFYWKANPVDNLFTNTDNWTDALGGQAPLSSTDGQPRPASGDNVYFTNVSNITTINGNGGNCNNLYFTNPTSSVYTFTNNLNIFGNLDSPHDRLILGGPSYPTALFTFNGSGTKTIEFGGTYTSDNRVNFDFYGDGSYTLLANLRSYAATGQWRLYDDVQVSTNGFDLEIGWINILFPSNTASIDLSNSTIHLDNSLTFGWPNGTLTPGANTSVTAVNTRITAQSFHGNGSLKTFLGAELINFSGFGGIGNQFCQWQIEADTVRVPGSTFYMYAVAPSGSELTCDVFELTQPTKITSTANSGTAQNILRFNTFIAPPSCSGVSTVNLLTNSIVNFENTGAAQTIDILFRNTNSTGNTISSISTNDQGGNSGNFNWTAAPAGQTFWWVGGTGDWNEPTNWSTLGSGGTPQAATGCIPTLLDSVIFDDAGLATGDVVTNVGATDLYCRAVMWLNTPDRGGIQNGNSEFYNWFIHGTADFLGMNPTVMAKGYLYMTGSGTHTFTPANGAYPRTIHFNGTGSYSLQGNIESTNLSHLQGVLNLNGFDVTCTVGNQIGAFRSIQGALGTTRELYMTNSTITGSSATITPSGMVGFDATGSHIVLTEPTSIFSPADNGNGVVLTSMILPLISFTSTTGTPKLQYGSNIVRIEELNAASNLDQLFGGVKIGTLNLTGGTTLQVSNMEIFNGVNVSGASCGDLVTIKYFNNSSQGWLYKATSPFTIDRAYMQNISAHLGVPLTVTNGVDGGNNLNVTIGAGTPREFYWVGNTGDWTDGTHWSIGVSGGNPATTNPNGCIPTAIDNVYFDVNSFTLANQTVNIPVNANCHNMSWTGSGFWTPIFDGANAAMLNIYGSFTLESGVEWDFPHRINMLGADLTLNSQTINTDGVVLSGSIWFQGAGRYDLLNDIEVLGLVGTGYNSGSFFLQNGHVFLNSFDVIAPTVRLYLEFAYNQFDASNSTITARSIWNSHAASSVNNYDFSNSSLVNGSNAIEVFITTPDTVNYHNFHLGGSILRSTGTVISNNVTRTALTTTTLGNWVMDTLILAQSSVNTFQGGRTYVVNDTLVAYGTPCVPIVLQATGGIATYESTSLNTFINFGNILNMTASLAPPGATAADYQVIGSNLGNSANWTFSPSASLPYLGNYAVSANCDALPYLVSTSGFSPVPGSSFFWSDSSTTADLLIDSSGVYSVTVTYAPNCSVTDSIEFSINNSLDVQPVSLINPLCFDDSTGTISTVVNGGNSNFNYNWTSPSGNSFTINPSDSSQLLDLAAGDYQIIVSQENSPVCADTLLLTITEPTPLVSNLSPTTLLCNGDADAEITANPSGGTPGYEVSLNGGAFSTAPFTFNGLGAGTYEVVVQDFNGCTDTLLQTITEPTQIQSSAVAADVLCNGDANGSLNVSVNGGTPAYNASLNGGAFAPLNATYGGLAAGSYQLIVEDQNGCRDTLNQTINEPTVLLANTSVTSNYNGANISCNGLTDGAADGSAVGGTAGYSYSWNTSPAQTTPAISGLGAGTYVLTVTDQNGCVAQSSVTLTEPVLLSNSFVVDQDANCNVADGAATITSNGGTPAYVYTWSNNPLNTSNSANDLAAGVTSVTITDANGCTDNVTITINSINAPIAYLSADSVLCFGGLTGVTMVDSVSGNGGYTYNWTDAQGNPIGQVGSTATGLAAGTYFVEVTDQNGCLSVESITVDEPTSPVEILVDAITSPLCNASSEGSITVTAIGGTGTIDYQWNTSPVQSTSTANNLSEGSYTVTVQDQNGCSADSTIELSAPAPLALSTVVTDVSCFEGNDGEIEVVVQGGTPTYTYGWTGTSSATATAANLSTGVYTAVVVDANGCSDSIVAMVAEPELLEVTFVSSVDPDCGANNGSIEIDVVGGTPAYTYSWNNGVTAQTNNEATSGLNSVTVIDQNGCTQSLEIDLSCLLFEIPELLTPNSDGLNDTWSITGLENFPNTTVQIFNRWGTEVYASNDYQNDWDGTSQSSLNVGGNQLPESSYFYILTLGGDSSNDLFGKVFKGYIYIKQN